MDEWARATSERRLQRQDLSLCPRFLPSLSALTCPHFLPSLLYRALALESLGTDARRTARLEEENDDAWLHSKEGDGDGGEGISAEHRAIAAASPMVNDVFDDAEEMNRRAEVIDMANGAVFARTAGDPTNPLVLYIHDGGMLANNTSLMWCGLMSSLSTAKRESFAVAAAALKEREDAGGRRKGRQSQGGGGDAGGGDGSMPRLNLKGVGPAGADKGTGRDGGSDDTGGEAW